MTDKVEKESLILCASGLKYTTASMKKSDANKDCGTQHMNVIRALVLPGNWQESQEVIKNIVKKKKHEDEKFNRQVSS